MNFVAYLNRNFIYPAALFYRARRITLPMNNALLMQALDPESLVEHQANRLNSLLRYARTNTEYYKNYELVTGCEDLRNIPMISKADIQRNRSRMQSGEYRGRVVIKTTGGSTGEPVTIRKTSESWLNELAATWRGYLWAGVKIGDPQARFWGIPLTVKGENVARITDFACNRIRLSAFRFDEESMERYVARIRKFRPKYFYGYVSMLSEFADYCARNCEGDDFGLNCIITTSEVLTSTMREKLQRVFGARVFNEYGCGEVGTIAHECPLGRMHMSADNVLVEIVNDGEPCADGLPGEIVVTELNNRAMPLIRYRLGDYGTISRTKCDCGVRFPVLENIYGREYDILKSRSGASYHGEAILYIFEEIERDQGGIRQFKVEQLTLDRFVVSIVRDRTYSNEVERAVEKRFREYFGETIEVDFVYRDQIDREKSGKMRLVVGMPNGKS